MITQLDLRMLDWIWVHLHNGVLDALVPIITLFGEGGYFWIGLALILLIVPKTRKLGLAMAVALVLDGLLCNLLIKPLVARPRPWTFRPGMEQAIAALTVLPADFSFPSGHTAVAFAGSVALLASGCKRWGIAAVALAVLVGLSRLYLFIHYPTDVLCGALLGAACGLAAAALVKSVGKRFKMQEK